MRRRAHATLLATALLAVCVPRVAADAGAGAEHCVWRVTLRAAPEGDDADEALWRHAASLEEAKSTCVVEATAPRRCAGFAWRAASKRDAARAGPGVFLPLPFERVAPLRRTEKHMDVYQARSQLLRL